MADPIPPKKTKGQQKIEVKPMDDAKKRSVTFTKRRAGLFKKADQLCALTGAEVALMVISPGGKPFTFGSPDVDAVIARYKSQVPQSPTVDHQKAELKEIMEQLAYEDKRAEELKQRRRKMHNETWMAAPCQTHSKAQQKIMKERLTQLCKIFSQPPSFYNCLGLFSESPLDSTFEFPTCSFTALLTQNNPELQGSSELSCRPIGNQNFGGNVILTPPSSFYTGESSSSVMPAVTQNHIFADYMMLNNHDNVSTGESSSMVPTGNQNHMFDNSMILTPPGNFYPGKSSSSAPAGAQNHILNDNIMLNNNNNFYTGESSLVVAAGTQNHMADYNMTLNSHGDFFTGESSSVVPAETQSHMFEGSMVLNSHGNFSTGESSSMVPAETQNDMFEGSMILNSHGNFSIGESSSMLPPGTHQSHMFGDNMLLSNNDNFNACVSSSMASENQSIMFDDDMMFAAYDNFFTSGSLTEELALNQFFDENIMNPPLDSSDAYQTSTVVPPAGENQIFDENIMVPRQDNCHTYESTVVKAASDDESLLFDENLRFFLGDEFFASSYSMVPPEQSRAFNENGMPPPPQPPPCDEYGPGSSGFN